MEVTSVSDARAGLSRIIGSFRDGSVAPVIIGSHRRPEAVLVPFARSRRRGRPWSASSDCES